MAAAFDDARTGTTWSTPNDHRTAGDGSAESSPIRGSDYAELSRRVRLALVAGQVAFVGHDAGHRQIFGSRRPNDLVGLARAKSSG